MIGFQRSRALTTIALALSSLACDRSPRPAELLAAVDRAPAEVSRGPLGTVYWRPEPGAVHGVARALGEEEEDQDSAPFIYNVFGGASEPADAVARTRRLGYTGDEGASSELVIESSLRELGYVSGVPEESYSEPASEPAPRTWRRAGAPVHATTLRVGDEDELPLLGIEASAWVDGFRARVLLDCVYRNDRERQLEGTFKLRLPEGATPYYLAFGEEVLRDDATWKLPERDRSWTQGPEPESVLGAREGHWKGAREARLVPKHQAARAYGNTVRQRVDPALMEWVGAGVFQARVFPLLPGAVHRVVVGYETDLVPLPARPGEYELRLELPLDLPALSLDLHVLAGEGQKVVVEPEAPSAWVSAGLRRTHRFTSTEHRDFRVRVSNLESTILVSYDDTGYFAADLTPRLEAGEGRGAPTAVFVVDTSLSSAAGGFAVWLELLEAILENNRDHLADFAVLFFDVAPRWWRPELTRNTEDAVSELRAYAEALALEGASDLGAALGEAVRPGWLGVYDGPTWDLFLLSDGAATWGPGDVHAFSAAARRGLAGPVFAYSTGLSGTDRRVLEHLTRESEGALFTISGPSDVEAASTAHHGRPWRVEELRVPGSSDLLLRGRPTAVFPGQRLRLVGRGAPGIGDSIEVVLAQGARRATCALVVVGVLETPLATRAFGEVATAQLEELGRATRDAARAFATHFRVPGEACSLLMLESEDDYAAQGVLEVDETAAARTAGVDALVVATLDRLSSTLEEPARALLELLDSLAEDGALGEPRTTPEELEELGYAIDASSPEAVLRLDPELVVALTSLPAEALHVRGEPLDFVRLRADGVPPAFRAELKDGEPAYVAVQSEAARRFAELEIGDAVRALACLVELNPGDGTFERDVAQTLQQWKLFGHAYQLLLRVARSRPFEPQSFLSLARCAEELGKGDLALFWYAVALQGEWDVRFGDFRAIAALDALHFLRSSARGSVSPSLDAWARSRVPEIERLARWSASDVAVAIQWNTDSTDVDLHVIEPSGEHCYYGHRETKLGAHLSRDVTQGFGPELYVLPEARQGEYFVFVNYFAGDPNRTAVRTKVLATVYQRCGSPDEVLERREIQLDAEGAEHGVALLALEP